MNNNIEKEYKVLLSKEQFDQLISKYKNLEFHKQINIYYDTEDFCIRKHHGAMRIRDIEGKHIFTLKLPSSNGLLEFEKDVSDNRVDALQDEEITHLLATYGLHGTFHEIARLETQRAVYFTGEAEVCFDISTYNHQTDYEIEYEYKKEHDGLSVFQTILKDIDIVYHENCKSKIQRALDTK